MRHAGLLLGGLCFATASYGQTPFPAVFSSGAEVQTSSNVGFTTLSAGLATPGSVSVGPGCIDVVTGGCGSAAASTSTALEVSASGSTTATGYDLPQAASASSLSVYYYVIGPSPAYTVVPMVFSGNWSGSASGTEADSSAGIELTSTTGAISVGDCATSYSSTCSSSFSAPFLFDSANGFSVYSSNVASGTYFTNLVSLTAGGQVDVAGQYSAEIDPTLEIDPTWLATHPGYSLVFSSNYSPVPLPAAAWLLLSGLGGLAAIARRRGR